MVLPGLKASFFGTSRTASDVVVLAAIVSFFRRRLFSALIVYLCIVLDEYGLEQSLRFSQKLKKGVVLKTPVMKVYETSSQR